VILKVITALAVVFGIFWTIKEKKIFPAIITLGMVISIVLVFYPNKTIHTSGFYLYMGFAALAFVYGLTVKNKEIWTRIIIILMSASIFTHWLWVFNHWHGNTLLFPIFTLLVGFAGILGKVKLKSELGFLTILAVDAVAIIIENWMKSN